MPLVPGYVAEIRLERVNLLEALCHWCSRHRKFFFAGYLLLLSFVRLKPFSLILSIDVLST